jgi:hypothetical protein
MARRRCIAAVATVAAVLLAHVAGASASTPPRRALVFDPVRGSIGGVHPGDRMTVVKQLLGEPDRRVDPGGGPVWIWLRHPSDECTVWAEAAADGAHPTRIGDFVYRGAISTAKGDRLGTALRVVKRHWPGWRVLSKGAVGGSQGPNYGRITSWGSVAFGFDTSDTVGGVAVRGSTEYWQPVVFACLTH